MKRILLILILITGWQLSHAQRYYVVPEDWAKAHKQYRITDWWGIDPVQIKSGEWVISEECYYLMTTKFIESKQFANDVKIRADSVRVELEKYPARVITKDEWKTYEGQMGEKTIPK